MEFKQNVPIYAANREAVGHLDRVVVDTTTKAISHIVVQKGGLKKDSRVVPLSLIAEAEADRIILREEAGDLDGLQQFEEKQYAMSEGATGGSGVVTQPRAGMPGAVVSEPRPKYVKQI